MDDLKNSSNSMFGESGGKPGDNYNSYNSSGSNDFIEQQEGQTIYSEQKPEESNVVIDLGGGYEDSDRTELHGATEVPGIMRKAGYTENIQKKKNGGKRIVAGFVALTVLNLAIMGGMFLLGKNIGSRTNTVASKQELVDTLQSENPSDSGIVGTATQQGEMTTTEIAKKIGPAVVGIRSIIEGQMSIFNMSTQAASEGSGVILSQDGYIVTNNHVVDGATSIQVMLNTGTEYEAQLIGKDEQTDLAVIKIEPTEQLTIATLGDSAQVEVGETVVAIGNPMGLEFFGSVTQGIISAINRTVTVDDRTMNLIQTDAAINSGNSGGALINTRGEIIGINSVKVSVTGVEGMGFAIPSSEVKTIVADLLEFGYVKGRPVFGINSRDVNEYMSQVYSWPRGVQVMGTTTQAAKDAGLQQGDIITEVDGQAITTTNELNEIKNSHKPGDVLTMKVYKYATGRTETASITLSEQIPG